MSGNDTCFVLVAKLSWQLAGLSLLANLEGLRLTSNLVFDITLNSLHYAASLSDKIDAVRGAPLTRQLGSARLGA